MSKDVKTTLVLLVMSACAFAALLILPTKRHEDVTKSSQKVNIDSISVGLRYPNLPDEQWRYHTKLGVFSSTKQLYSVGDSIEVQIVKINK